jgi:AcrR family transcriptional regulator
MAVDQRERLLRAAMDAFAAQGFRGASLDKVADAVGITRQGVLHYFPSKVHLLIGVLDLPHEDDEALVERLVERHEGFADTLLALARHNATQLEIVRLFTVLAAESVEAEHPGHDWFVARYRRVREELERDIVAAGLDSRIPAASLAALITAVMDGLQLQHLLDPGEVDMVGPLADLLTLLEGGERRAERAGVDGEAEPGPRRRGADPVD